MAIKKKSLTDSQVQKLEPRYEPHWVASNLYLKVGKKAKTWWVYKDVDGRKKKARAKKDDDALPVKQCEK